MAPKKTKKNTHARTAPTLERDRGVLRLPDDFAKDRKFLAAAIGLSMLLALIHLCLVAHSPTFSTPIIDAAENLATARQIIAPMGPDKAPFYHSAFYPSFLATLFYAFGEGLLVPRLVQVGLSGAACLLLYALTFRLFSRTVARVAAVLWALYGPVIFFTSELVPVTWTLFFYSASLYALVIALEKPTRTRWAVVGLALGLSVITRPDILIFSVTLISWMTLSRREPRQPLSRKLTAAGIVALGVALPMAAVGLYNYSVSNQFLMLPTNSGLNCYLGNNPNCGHTEGIRPGADWEAVTHMPLYEGFSTSEHDLRNNAYYYGKVFQYLRSDPVGWLGCLLFKTRTLVGGYELPADVDMYSFRSDSLLLAVLLFRIGSFGFPFGVLLPLALVGIFTSRKRPGRLWCLYAFMLCMLVPLVGFQNAARYRMALLPALFPFAAAALVAARDSFRHGDRRAAARGVGACLALVAVVNWPYPHFSKAYNFQAETMSFVGMQQAHVDGHLDEGIRWLEHATTLAPEFLEARTNLAWALEQRSGPTDVQRAEEEYRRAMAINPRADRLRDNFGVLLAKQKKYGEAAEQFEAAIRVNPRSAEPYFHLGNAQVASGQSKLAVSSYEHALERNPDYWQAHFNLASVLEEMGDHDGAILHYQRSALRVPDQAESYNRMAIVYARLGKYRDAEANFARAAALKPDDDGYQQNLQQVRKTLKAQAPAPSSESGGDGGDRLN